MHFSIPSFAQRLTRHTWLVAVLFGLGTSPSGAAETNKPLNIVFILADDLGYGDLSCYGQEKFKTPNIDSLAKDGLKLTQHYSGAPVCAPARCVLMTGRHLGHAQVRGNMQAKVKFPEFKEGQIPLTADIATLPQTLREGHYHTGAMGKWGLGPVGSTGDPNKKGFDLFFGYNCQAVAHSYYPAYLWRNDQQVPLNNPAVPGHAPEPTGGVTTKSFLGQKYAPLEMIAEAESFLKEQKGKPDPFFLYLAFIEPHVSMHPPEAEVAKFPAEWDRQPYHGENGYLAHARPRAAYAAMITMLDGYVGRVLKALETMGVAENTLVVFTSDNGPTHEGKPDSPFHIGGADTTFFKSNAGAHGYKGSVYEGGLRVPCLVRCPGKVKPGGELNHPCYFADWFPTLVAAAGLKAPAGMDGENIWPILTGAAPEPRKRPMLWVFPEYTGQVAIRLGDFKVLKRGLKTKKPGPWEVYDLKADPVEATNLAAAKPELITEAVKILNAESSENAHFPLAIPPVSP